MLANLLNFFIFLFDVLNWLMYYVIHYFSCCWCESIHDRSGRKLWGQCLWIINILACANFSCNLGGDIVSKTFTFGGSGSSLLMVSTISNNAFELDLHLSTKLQYRKVAHWGVWWYNFPLVLENIPTLPLEKDTHEVWKWLYHSWVASLLEENNTLHTNNYSLIVQHTSRILHLSSKLNVGLFWNGPLF